MTELVTIKIKGYRCLRCKHEWLPKGKEEPRVCPKCHSPYWNKAKRHKTPQIEKTGKVLNI